VPFWQMFPAALTANVGYWATLSLNIPDFTRYARSQRSQALGQAFGLPATMTAFAFIGVAVTSANVHDAAELDAVLPAEPGDIEREMQLSLRWAERSKRAFETAAPGYMLSTEIAAGYARSRFRRGRPRGAALACARVPRATR